MNNFGQIVGYSYDVVDSIEFGHNPTLWEVIDDTPTSNKEIELIINEIHNLVYSGMLSNGHGEACIAKLESAKRMLAKGNTKAGINILQAFINQIEAFSKTGNLSQEKSQNLINYANVVIYRINP